MPLIPDCDGRRYCRACDCFLTVDKFDRAGPRRYYCAAHMKSLFRTRGVPELAAINLRKRLRRDLIALGGEATIRMTHAELMSLIARANKTPADYHELCMLPSDPMRPVTPANAFFATPTQRKFLIAMHRMEHDVSRYKQEVAGMTLGHGLGKEHPQP
jgi:hypothetical protein